MLFLVLFLLINFTFIAIKFFLHKRKVNVLSLPRNSNWRKIRNQHLEKNPFCSVCRSKKNLSVHHIKSFHENPHLELDPENLITLCENKNLNCHFVFGHKMNWRNINEKLMDHIEIMNKFLEV
jgi:5-methylcytosine-specific restriction endonuclease McrA